MPTADVSQASLEGRLGSYWVRNMSDAMSSFTFMKASSLPVVHFHCLPSPLVQKMNKVVGHSLALEH